MPDFQVGSSVQASLMVRQSEEKRAKNNNQFILGSLYDKNGEYQCCIWDTRLINMKPNPGDVIHAVFIVKDFNNNIQLDTDREQPIRLTTAEAVTDFSPFVRVGPITRELFLNFYDEHCRHLIEDKPIEELLNILLSGKKFYTAPAAKGMHHAYRGGLVEHCYRLLTLFIGGLQTYDGFKRCRKGLVIFGIIGHDYCKTLDYVEASPGQYDMTRYGNLISHLPGGPILMTKLLIKHNIQLPPELEMHMWHILLSHHGQLSYGSPIEPRTPEAIITHNLDMMDGKLSPLYDMKDGEYKRNFGGAIHLRTAELESHLTK